MKIYLRLFAGFCLLTLVAAANVHAQSGRLTSLSEQLESQANDLAERTYADFRDNRFSQSSDLDAVFLAQNFSGAALVFHRMVSDRRSESELRSAASILSDFLTRADRDFSRRNRWSDVRRTFNDIQSALSGGGFGGGRRDDGGGRRDNDGGRNDDGRTTGRLRWQGTVDDNVQLVIRDDHVEVRTLGGSEYNDANYNFTSPLPRRRGVNITVNKLNGRGDVRVLQQPSRDNDYTAVVEIRDTKGGAKQYEIEVVW
jgi:hypothetical protein